MARPYVIRRLKPASLAGPAVWATAIAVLAVAGTANLPALVVLGALLAAALLRAWQASQLVCIDDLGVELSGHPVIPWAIVEGVELSEGFLAVRLPEGEDAPAVLLDGVRFDPEALRSALAEHGTVLQEDLA